MCNRSFCVFFFSLKKVGLKFVQPITQALSVETLFWFSFLREVSLDEPLQMSMGSFLWVSQPFIDMYCLCQSLPGKNSTNQRVSLGSCSYMRIPKTEWLIDSRNYFSQSRRLGVWDHGRRHNWILVRTFFRWQAICLLLAVPADGRRDERAF